MNDPQHNLPLRIAEIRGLANVSQTELAKKLGISTSLVSHWEKGTRTPSTSQLIALSQHLGVALDYLLNATVRPRFHFRARSTSPQHGAIEQALVDASAQVHFIDTASHLAEKAPKPFSLRADFDSFDALPNVTTHFRETLKLNRRVTLDELKQALSEWNIYIFEWSMPWDLSGLSFRGPFTAIFINHEHSPARRLFTLAHEFAHVVFHLGRESQTDSANVDEPAKRMNTVVSIASHRDPLEKQANAFASEFLMPLRDIEQLVEKFGNRLRDPAQLEAVARHFNVSRDAIFYRLTQCNFFRWSEKSAYFGGKFPAQEIPTERVKEIDEQVDARFRDQALALLQQGAISTGKLAEWFFTQRHVIDNYLFELEEKKDLVISDEPNVEEGEIA